MRIPRRPHPPNVIGVGRRLRWARESLGLSQKEMALAIGENTYRPVADRESALIAPDVGWLYRVATFTGADIVWLLTGVGPEPQPRSRT